MLDQHLIYSGLAKQLLRVHVHGLALCNRCQRKLTGILFLHCVLAEAPRAVVSEHVLT